MYSSPVNDNLQSVVRELTTTLAAVAQDFSNRVENIASAEETQESGAGSLYAKAVGLLKQQELRLAYFPRDLFHEPAWNMLIALFVAHHDKHPMNVKALTAFAGAPPTTSLRWVDHLHERGLIDRVTDSMDRRRVEVSLSDAGLSAMTKYLGSIS
jgi:hypothetical protein